jgi:hypothetical protein
MDSLQLRLRLVLPPPLPQGYSCPVRQGGALGSRAGCVTGSCTRGSRVPRVSKFITFYSVISPF